MDLLRPAPLQPAELAALIDAVPTPIALAMDAAGTLRCNRAFEELLAGRPHRFMLAGVPLERDELPARQALRLGCAIENARVDVFFEDDGSCIALAGKAEPLFDESGGLAGAIAAFTDVTPAVRGLREQERALSDGLHFLTALGSALAELTDPAAILAAMAAHATARMCEAAIVLYVRDNGFAKLALAHHRDGAKSDRIHSLWESAALTDISSTTSFRVAQSSESSVVPDLRELAQRAESPLYRDWVHGLIEHGKLAREVIVPMRVNGMTNGVVAFLRGGEAPFTQLDVRVFEEAARRTGAALESAASMTRSRDVKLVLQKALLPPRLPEVPGLHFDAVYVPSENDVSVGGDWYDARLLPDGNVLLSIGDVMGHGVNAAAIMGQVRHAIAVLAGVTRNPAEILAYADSDLQRLHPDVPVTALVAILDPASASMRVAGAGHPAPYLVHAGCVTQLALPHDLPLGFSATRSAYGTRIALQPESTLFFYTDGLTECTRDSAEIEPRIIRTLGSMQARAARPARLLLEAILPERCADDVAILSVRFEGR